MLCLIQPKVLSQKELEEKRALTAKFVAADKARAAAILLQALQHLDSNRAAILPKKERIT